MRSPDHQDSSSPAALRRALPLLLGVAFLVTGSGLASSALGIRAASADIGTFVVGAVMAAYYGGFLAGSMATPTLIARVGHIRVFSGLAAFTSVAVVLQAVWTHWLAWFGLRLAVGLCVSGLFIVAETWLNRVASNRSRGQLLAAYMVVVTGGLAVGQLLLNVSDPRGYTAFILASVLVSMAVIPVSLSPVTAPDSIDLGSIALVDLIKVAPLGVAGAIASGFVGGAVIGFGAVYGDAVGLTVAQTSIFLFAVLAGGVVLQFVVGSWSDRVDRRYVIGGFTLAAAAIALGVALVDGRDHFGVFVALAAMAGGALFPLYSLSNAHLNDYLPHGLIVAAGARMVLLNGVGAIAGPLLCAVAIGTFGPESLFVIVAVAYAVIGVYAFFRITRRAAVPVEDRADYVPVPTGVGPTTAALVPDAADELYPLVESTATDGATRLRYSERGHGWPIVLVHDAGASSEQWAAVQLRLADAGYRAIAFDARGHGRSTNGPGAVDEMVDDLRCVLAQSHVPVAVVIGHGAGAAVAVRFARESPERVAGLVLVSAEQLFRVAVPRSVKRRVERAIGGILGARAGATLRARTKVGRPRDPAVQRLLARDLRRAGRLRVSSIRRDARREADRGVDGVASPMLWVRGDRLTAGDHTEGDEVVVAGAGYVVALEAPDELVDAVVPFVAAATNASTHATIGLADAVAP